VLRLVTLGILVTWLLGSLFGMYIAGLPWPLAVLAAAILTVSSPTVIIPILRILKLKPGLASVVKWEGILNDPVGVLLAVLVFEAVRGGEGGVAPAVSTILTTIVAGALIGTAGAALIVIGIRKFWGPHFLDNVFVLAVVFLVFIATNTFQREAGLLAVTLMGVPLANQRVVDVHAIVEFKESLRVILIASLFIILSARLTLEDLAFVDARVAAFIGLMVIVTRPIAVWLSTAGTPLVWSDRSFLMWMAPRGIVAAAVASVFALQLESAGIAGARILATVIFATILVTTLLYGLTARRVAKRLRVS
jgi:NhaP-type Na+/H+ or K+/H+ antiporter